MALLDIDRTALCHHLANRFPGFQERAQLARDAALADAQLTGAPLAAWGSIVDEADSNGSIGRLLHCAALLHPNDDQLGEMARSAARGELRVPPADDPKTWLRNTAIAGGLVIGLGVLALAGDALLPNAASEAAPVVPPVAAGPAPSPLMKTNPSVADPAQPIPPSDGPVVAEPAESAEATSVDAAIANPNVAEPVVADPSTLETAEPGEVTKAVSASSQVGPGCEGPATTVVGYAYAGTTKPGPSSWTPARSLNVRLDYPRRDNGYTVKAPVACIIRKGATVELVREPIAVDGGAYWVPVMGGSVRR